MATGNRRIGSALDDLLGNQGLLEEVDEIARKRVISVLASGGPEQCPADVEAGSLLSQG